MFEFIARLSIWFLSSTRARLVGLIDGKYIDPGFKRAGVNANRFCKQLTLSIGRQQLPKSCQDRNLDLLGRSGSAKALRQ